MRPLLLFGYLAMLVGAGCVSPDRPPPIHPNGAIPASASMKPGRGPDPEPLPVPESEELFGLPLDRAAARITKKPFGLHVAPGDSPVSPERFSGYHAGIDFEAFENEQDQEIDIRTICDGELALKKIAEGYGGVAVQRCTFKNQPITVIYGHLRLSSIAADVGETLRQGERLGVLGKGYSSETDGERKHLHLGIHRGTALTLRGYVPSKTELDQWLDAREVLPL